MSLPTLRIIAFILGIFLITLAASMLIPMLTLLLHARSDDLDAFLWSSLATATAGIAMVIPGRPKDAQLRPRDMYLLTTGSWLVVCIFAALPMVLIQHISYTDAFFETMSGDHHHRLNHTGRPRQSLTRAADLALNAAMAGRDRLYRHGRGHPAAAAGRRHAPVPDRIIRLGREGHAALAHGGQIHPVYLPWA